MTQEIKLSAETREAGKANKIRKEGYIPATIYGPSSQPANLKVKRQEFEKAFAQAGESHVIDLSFSGKSVKAIIKEVQSEPVKGIFIHVDFYQIDMNKKIHTEIPLRFIGESKAVKELGGILVKDADAVEVKCLASDLVDFIEVDLSVLNNLHDAIHIKDLKLPKGVEVLAHDEDMVASVIEQRAEKEIAPVAPAVTTPTTDVKKVEPKK